MPVEPGVVDANILVYAVNPDTPQHAASHALLKVAGDPSVTLYVTSAPETTVAGLLELLKRHAITGSDVFDIQIVATMQANRIRRIYTFNIADFERFSELAVVTP